MVNDQNHRTWIAHKADCSQEHHLFISTKHPQLPPFVKLYNMLSLPIQNVFLHTIEHGIRFYVQSGSTYEGFHFNFANEMKS